MEGSLSYVRRVLDEAYERLSGVYLSTSVLGPVRLYSAKSVEDREFWALFCALVDFQVPVVSVLNPMLTGLAQHVEKRGLSFLDLVRDAGLAAEVLREFGWSSPRGRRRGFTHRFVKIEDVVELLAAFRRFGGLYGSLGSFVKESYARHAGDREPMEGVLADFLGALRECGGRSPLVPKGAGSAFKRFNLFFRWLVRPYPDLGLWAFIDRRHLLVSLDEGLRRVLARAFGLHVHLDRRGVLEATRFLKRVNPEDPAKYDYVLSRVSIMGYCARDLARSQCCMCLLASVCLSSRLPKQVEAKPLSKGEMEILEDFLKLRGEDFDRVVTEYPLGRFSADALLHAKGCTEYVVEVERELNYAAIGQAVTYRYLYYRHSGRLAKPMIVCRKASRELAEAARLEQGIEVVEVPAAQR